MEVLIRIIAEAWATFAQMSPYLLIGFGVAGVLSTLIPAETVERHLGGRGFMSVFKAALVGVPLPLCSCSVIPVATSLRRHGSSRGATLSFLISTPQTGVDSILVTYGLLGPVFAIVRPVVAFVSGLIGGMAMDRLEKESELEADKSRPRCTDSCCEPSSKGSKLMRILRHGFVVLPRDIAKPMLVGLVVAGLLGALVPHDFLASHAVGSGLPAMLLMMLVGIPLYVCATASVPIGAALIMAGVSPGAVLVFLITGPATNAATIATVWKVLGKRAMAVYLGTIAVTALAAGYLLDFIFKMPGIQAPDAAHCAELSLAAQVSAAILLVVLAGGLVRHRNKEHAHKSDQWQTLRVEGMTCDHCGDSVRNALARCKGVETVEVDVKSGIARVGGHDLVIQELKNAIANAGYKVTGSAARDGEAAAPADPGGDGMSGTT